MRSILLCLSIFCSVTFLNGAEPQKPISGVTARATSRQVEKLFGPENLCNDHGLTDTGPDASLPDGSRKLTTNAYAGGGCMWHSGYIALGGDEHPIVEFDLGKVTDVNRFHVWNHNANPHRGFQHVAVMISDDGKTWRAVTQRFRFAKASGQESESGESHTFVPSIRARYIRFHCESTHRSGGNRELAGLGKVRFFEGKSDAATAPAKTGRYPVGAMLIDLTAAPYSAKGDGLTDDTASIQRAIDDWQGSHRILYLPAGTYLLTKPLRYKPGRGNGYNNLRGESLGKTILKLRDATFTDVAKPQPVLSLGYNGQENGKGVHADWFNNNVGDFTVDTGRGNPGAIGLQFYSNNVGALRDVHIVSRDGKGHIGLDLGYADQNGPCLIRNIRIDGFATGVSSGATVNSQTAEHVTVMGSTKAGWENRGQCLAIRKLNVTGTGPGLISRYGVVAIIDSEFDSIESSRTAPAIQNGETLFARNIRTKGFSAAIENLRKTDTPTPNHADPAVAEWVSTPPLTLYPIDKPRSLNLPVEETPDVAWDDAATWANVRAFRDLADPDDSAAFQRAIDSGATTVFFPSGGRYSFGKPVEIRGHVRRIVGFHAGFHGVKGPAVWNVAQDGAPTVVVQDTQGEIELRHASMRTVVARNGQGLGGTLTGGGKLFLENIVADWSFTKGQAWARQFNNEREGLHIRNAGATLWILGLKTERGGTLIETRDGGSTEVLGGLSYTTTKGKLAPMFVSSNARVSYVLGEVCYSGNPYSRLVEQHRGAESKTLNRNDAPLRPSFLQGGQLPLFVGEP